MEVTKLLGLAAKIDHLDYYKLLGLKRDAQAGDIRKAYHRRARSLHPDRFYEHPDEELRQAIDIIFKRVAEAYTILRDTEKRSFYDKMLDGPVRKVRYTDEEERALKQAQKAATGRTPQGRKFYEEAQRLHTKGEAKKAIQALRMALTFEQDNEHFRELLTQWETE